MATFLLELGTEELPASFVTQALGQWQQLVPASLAENYLTYTKINFYGTPRRLAVVIEGLPRHQPDQTLEIKGPALASAFVNNQPTKAVIGFARSRGVDVADLVIKETDKGSFVFAQQKVFGKELNQVLTALAPTWITGLQGNRLMRWGTGELKFPRPMRWLVTLLNEQVLPIALENLQADRLSQGHRVMHPRSVVIDTAVDYVATLREAFVMVDAAERRHKISTQIRGVSELVRANAEIPEALLEEVTQLVEWPTAIVGEFEREYLQLPTEVIKTEMVSHQRYFPMYLSDRPEELLPYFITISNGDPEKSRLIAAGNGRVIRARLADGKFFYDRDRAVPLESFLPKLQKVTFQEQLGSVAEKVERLIKIAQVVIKAIANLEVTNLEQAQISRTAQLCKADLVTQMVKEFPELQGTMGSYYTSDGEVVAQGILEHYLPRGAADQLPQSLGGRIIAISDRIDTLVGIFGLGLIPTGSSDPFALRRAAAGIVQIAWHSGYALNIPQLLSSVFVIYTEQLAGKLTLAPATEQNLFKWFQQRCETLLKEQGIDYDLVNAVFGENDQTYVHQGLEDLSRLRDRALFLHQSRQDGTLDAIYEVVTRATRLATQGELSSTITDVSEVVERSRLSHPAEQALYQAIAALVPNPTYDQLWSGIRDIAPILSQFFDELLVMDEDLDVRRDRLNMLGIIRNYSRILADFSAISPAGK
jgi:glycyl-tRNA synthetase beta chain